MTQREVIYLLGGMQPLEEVGLALRVRPEHVPVVAVRVHHAVELQEEPDELGLALEHFEEAEVAVTLGLVVRPVH